MSYGDGSITEILNPNGKSYKPKRWRICLSYSIEVVNEDGKKTKKRKKVQRNMRGTKAEAVEFKEKLLAEYDENGRPYTEIEAGRKI